MARAAAPRRSTRQTATKKRGRSVYAEPDTDEEEFDVSSEDELAGPLRLPPTKRQRQAPARSTRSGKAQPQRAHRTQLQPTKKQKTKKLFVWAKPRKPNVKSFVPHHVPSDGKIPKWQQLPLGIWVLIFQYASHPLTESANVNWLMHTARHVSRTLAQPSLEAYYRSPALLTTLHPHHLLDLLTLPDRDRRYMDYNVKVRSLNTDVGKLAYQAHNRGYFDLGELVAELPQLRELHVTDSSFAPPYRDFGKALRWSYPTTLFDALNRRGQRMESWTWNANMVGKHNTSAYDWLCDIHASKSFQGLKALTVCGFDTPSPPNSASGTAVTRTTLADTICKLPSLTDLTLTSCPAVEERFLEHLPKTLQRLEISNCHGLTSDMLQTFLVSCEPSSIRELVLNHNLSLDLSFLTMLKATAPKLEVLKTDLHYYSARHTMNDVDPKYDHLIGDVEVPTWPATLRGLELVDLQRLSSTAAENLFKSLIESAEALPDLRRIVLQAHINIPWRERAGFRDQWSDRLQHVFLRSSEDPASELASFRAYRLFKQKGAGQDEDGEPLVKEVSHVRISPRKPHAGDTETYDSSEAPTPRPTRRSQRVATRDSRSATPADESSEDDDEEGKNAGELFVQGLCNVVDIRIDNQRPREEQFTEGDFLDAEASGDEDYHDGAEPDGDDGYAW